MSLWTGQLKVVEASRAGRTLDTYRPMISTHMVEDLSQDRFHEQWSTHTTTFALPKWQKVLETWQMQRSIWKGQTIGRTCTKRIRHHMSVTQPTIRTQLSTAVSLDSCNHDTSMGRLDSKIHPFVLPFITSHHVT